ncbi:EamA family transporter [Streptomyces mayteni]
MVSQSLAVVVLGVIVVATSAWTEFGWRLWFAVAAGLIGPLVLLCFYRALAQGPMGVVSPLAATAVVVAFAGVALASGPQLRGAPVQRETMPLTLVAALGFGAVLALISAASTTLTGLFLALFVQRLRNALAGGTALWVAARRGSPTLPPEGARAVTAALPALLFVGLADVAANATYTLATRIGPVTVAAMLASLYPVVTALAACGMLRERLRAVQAAGAGLAMTGTLLLAAG